MKLSDDLITLADETDIARLWRAKKEHSTVRNCTCRRAHVCQFGAAAQLFIPT
jgi:hypothetical protein